MALNVDLQVLTQPGATGNQTYSLSSNFDPKAVILWAVPRASDGVGAHYNHGMGFGTYRGSVVQQWYSCIRGLDAAITADLGMGKNTNALLVLMTDGVGLATRDLEIGLVSMQTGATSQVVLNWVNLHTTASIRVFMLVLGGSEISDAMVGSWTLGTTDAIDDQTVAAGFGRPELVFFAGSQGNASGELNNAGRITYGFAKQGEPGRSVVFAETDGNTASLNATGLRNDKAFVELQPPLAASVLTNAEGALDTTVSNWPTDGFRVVYPSNPLQPIPTGYLALRTTAQIATGENVAPIVGGLPVVQDNDAGFVPKLGFLLNWNLAASASYDTASADGHGIGIGATDGTDEAWAGFTEDDGAGTMVSKHQQSTAKIIQNYLPTSVLQSEADGSFSGNNFRLSWNDIDTVARAYQWLVMGDAPAAAAKAFPFPARHSRNVLLRR